MATYIGLKDRLRWLFKKTGHRIKSLRSMDLWQVPNAEFPTKTHGNSDLWGETVGIAGGWKTWK